ncbi:MAG: hypothetical protein QG652_1210 [Pseudomonadota bacterium]|nr:hypothetical protein [Pseudomonadota bacterium]
MHLLFYLQTTLINNAHINLFYFSIGNFTCYSPLQRW